MREQVEGAARQPVDARHCLHVAGGEEVEHFEKLSPVAVRARHLLAVNLRTARAAQLRKLGVERQEMGESVRPSALAVGSFIKLEKRRLLDREIARSRPLQDFRYVKGGAAGHRGVVGAVRHESASSAYPRVAVTEGRWALVA